MFVQPVWIAPLYNDFMPMKDKALEAKIVSLAERSGIEGSRIYEVAISEDTNRLNAYVNGIGKTKRIVIWDTSIAKLNEHELLAMMGHEMAHYVMGHVWKLTLFGSGLVIIAMFAVNRSALWLVRRYKGVFGFDSLADIASLPLFIMLINLSVFILSPAFLTYSRYCERESDRFALEITHFNHSAATMFSKFTTNDLAVPHGNIITRIWWGSHPEIGDRIDFCNTYKPWEKGEPIKYSRLFKDK
jgi:Zn-dependent protease with chaperone function